MHLILFLKVEIEHTFVFPEILLHTGEKKSKDSIAFSNSTLITFFKTPYTKRLFYGWKFTTQTENRHPNGNCPSSMLGKSLFTNL